MNRFISNLFKFLFQFLNCLEYRYQSVVAAVAKKKIAAAERGM